MGNSILSEVGCVEKGEKGAFKIANSWGTDFDNDGFIWMSYDALNLVSSVKNSDNVTLTNNTRKMGLFDASNIKVNNAKLYIASEDRNIDNKYLWRKDNDNRHSCSYRWGSSRVYYE